MNLSHCLSAFQTVFESADHPIQGWRNAALQTSESHKIEGVIEVYEATHSRSPSGLYCALTRPSKRREF